MIFFIIIIPILWYLIGRVIVCILLCEFNIKAFKEEWDNSGLVETWFAFIWPVTIIIFLIEFIKEEYDLH